MRIRIIYKISFVCFFLAMSSFSIVSNVSASEDEIGNIVIQRTMTLVGHEFYREFAAAWIPPPGGETFNICVQEKADARWGSLITILVDDRLVYRNVLGLRTRDLKDTAGKAVGQVRSHILSALLIDQKDDDDIATDGY